MADETQGSAEAAPSGSKPKAKVSPVRNIVGVVLLLAFSGTAAAEFLAYRSYTEAGEKLKKLIPATLEEPKADAANTQEKVEKEIGLGTRAKLKNEVGERSATYNWRGVLRTHKIKAYYTVGDPPCLVRIDTE